MTTHRPIWVGLLLAAFVAGGVLGPVAHRVQHGVAQADAPAAPCHPTEVHEADEDRWTNATGDRFRPECNLCARRLLLASPTPTPSTTPLTKFATTVVPSSHVAGAHVATDQFIRGPPTRLEARSV